MGICVKASIPWTPGGDLEELRAKVYEYAQSEKPGGEAKPWKAGTAALGATPTPEQQRSTAMFNAMDTSPKDGKLSRAELKAMVDKVNAAAMAAGEATVDPNTFFDAMDKNHDDAVDRSEAGELGAYLMRLSKGDKGAPPKPKAASKAGQRETPDMAAAMFSALDQNKDSQLSREEMKDVLEKTNEHNKAQGVDEDGDFFASLDADSNGFVDKNEAATFFAAMIDGLGSKSKSSDSSRARDEL